MQDEASGPAARFEKMFQQEPNTRCLNCGKSSKQWADLSHAIFLCLDCAAAYREISWITKIKSVNLDEWSPEELERMGKGGNDSYAKFLRGYGLELAELRTKVTCKASAYYRGLLDGKELGQQPPLEEGQQIDKQSIPLADMNSDEIFESAKENAIWLGGKTKELGKKGIKTVQAKWESGEIQEETMKVAGSVSTNAKRLWGLVKSKVSELASGEKGSGNNATDNNGDKN